MQNPIATATRGWIYVWGIILGALTGVAAAVLAVLGLDQWQPVVVAIASAIAVVSSTLARTNLSTEDAPSGS